VLPTAPICNSFSPKLFAGERGYVTIELVAVEDMRVSHVDVQVFAREGWTIGSGALSHQSDAVVVDLARTRVMEAGVLPGGSTRFVVAFEVPPRTPPSHAIQPGAAWIGVSVHVSIPWWPDGRYTFVMAAHIRPPATVVRTPVAVASRASATGPRLELALASSRLVAGERLVGSCTFFDGGITSRGWSS